ncbi:MAG: hypothetical protein QM765_00045 [Myxococcales bacterium]
MNAGTGLKVLFCVRSDLSTVGGGDVTQILRTRDALQSLGVQVQLSGASLRSRPAAATTWPTSST